ncbi:MAG: type II toxin-antitoxin system HicA family toxin [Methanothrix sp.]|nr:type II toxin-antitoxin system HicA family toxin [Methanothrix sp.]
MRRQAGSHVVLQKGYTVFSVPLHDELKKGTLKAILNQSGLPVEELLK